MPASTLHPGRILLIRLKSIGDVVLTLPAVHAIRDNFPAAKISFLTSRENAPLLRGFQDVDEIIAIDRAVLKGGNPLKIGRELVALLIRLRAPGFSLAVDFQGYGETELLAWWSGAPERLGTVYSKDRGWAYTLSLPRDSGEVGNANLWMLHQAGLPIGRIRNEYVLPADALASAREFFASHNLQTDHPILYIQPLTSASIKNWPLENYLQLAELWRARGMQVIFGGGPADQATLAPASRAGFVLAAGVPLLVSAGLMQLSSVVVGADTGLLHLAVAMGRRVVMLMKSNDPTTPHPFQHPDWTVVPPPGKAVADIAIADVMAAISQAMEELKGQPALPD
jgi:ADP-heptose:LPS heptosyltransferase